MSMTRPRPAEAASLHDTDFYTWAQRQAALIRAGRFDEADLENIAEEIEDLGSSKEAGLEAAYRLICAHLLKRMIQPERAARSWDLTISEQRRRFTRLLRKNPGLKSKLDDLFRDAYADARMEAQDETGVPITEISEHPPFTRQQVEDAEFWP